MGEPAEAGAVGQQELSTPDGSIAAVSGTIESHPNHRPLYAPLSEDARDMSMVMLNGHLLHLGAHARVRGGEVAGVQMKATTVGLICKKLFQRSISAV